MKKIKKPAYLLILILSSGLFLHASNKVRISELKKAEKLNDKMVPVKETDYVLMPGGLVF